MFNKYKSMSPLVFAFFSGALVFLLSAVYTVSAHRDMVAKARADALSDLGIYRSRLETNLYSRIFLTKTLAGYVSRNPDISPDTFETMVMDAVRNDRTISTISLSKDSVITYIYPLKGHEKALGLDLTAHPERREMVADIIRKRTGYVQGPVELVEGGVAFIMYTPIYHATGKNNGKYWGLADIVLFTDELLKEAGLVDEMSAFDFALKGKDGKGGGGEPFWGDGKVYQSDPVIQMITLPNGSWELAAVPRGGWPNFRSRQVLTLSNGFLLSLLAGTLIYVLMREPTRLNKEIEERKKVEAALRESETEIKRHRDDLETRVKERTDSIVAINRQLMLEIAERKEVERSIREISGRMLSAHESERKRLARELHDGLAQSLLHIKMNLQKVKAAGLADNDAAGKGVVEAIGGVSSAINELREMAMALRPSHIEDSDMDDILRWHGQRFEQLTGIRTSIDADKISCLSLKVKENLFRIFQEALNNVAKHSGADMVKIEMKEKGGRVRMTVSDNGKGLTPGAKEGKTQGIGLLTMRDRVELIGGDFAVDSLPNEGATIIVEAPLS